MELDVSSESEPESISFHLNHYQNQNQHHLKKQILSQQPCQAVRRSAREKKLPHKHGKLNDE